MYCENSDKAFVRFRYPGQSWDIFESNFPPVDVTIEQSQEPVWGHTCEGILYQIEFELMGGFFASSFTRFSPRPNDRGYTCSFHRLTHENSNQITTVWGEIRGFRLAQFQSHHRISNRSVRHCWRGEVPQYTPLEGHRVFQVLCKGFGSAAAPTEDYVWHTLWASGGIGNHYMSENWSATAVDTGHRYLNQNINCTPQCSFKISDTRGLVFERTADDCPEYEIDCGDDECPPGTCEVW